MSAGQKKMKKDKKSLKKIKKMLDTTKNMYYNIDMMMRETKNKKESDMRSIKWYKDFDVRERSMSIYSKEDVDASNKEILDRMIEAINHYEYILRADEDCRKKFKLTNEIRYKVECGFRKNRIKFELQDITKDCNTLSAEVDGLAEKIKFDKNITQYEKDALVLKEYQLEAHLKLKKKIMTMNRKSNREKLDLTNHQYPGEGKRHIEKKENTPEKNKEENKVEEIKFLDQCTGLVVTTKNISDIEKKKLYTEHVDQKLEGIRYRDAMDNDKF